MITNVIAYLHTTFAYQSAAMQLMVGQANFDAQQLHLTEPLPIVAPADTNDWHVAMPLDGVAGTLTTSNYTYRFNAGRLMSIQTRRPPHTVAERQPSLIDTNEAYQLARDWLTALSVDTSALESKYPHTVRFVSPSLVFPSHVVNPASGSIRSTNHVTRSGVSPNLGRPPVFQVAWGGAHDRKPVPGHATVQASVEILGSTKQCLGIRILNPDILKTPPLQVTNTLALLGPPPPPQHYVEEFFGGKAAYDTVARPDRVSVWLLASQTDQSDNKAGRTPVMALDTTAAAAISQALTDFNSYSWLGDKPCTPNYGVRLQFTKGADVVDFSWCYECDHLQVTHNGQSAEKDCDPARPSLIRVLRSVFPNDEIIKNLNLSGPSQPN